MIIMDSNSDRKETLGNDEEVIVLVMYDSNSDVYKLGDTDVTITMINNNSSDRMINCQRWDYND